jgi:hypothetical protein
MTIDYTTPYIVLSDMMIDIALVLYITIGLAMHSIIRKYKLEKELDRFAYLFYMETAVVLTLISFLICHFIQEIFINGSIVTSDIIGFVSGAVFGIVIIKWVKKKVRR